MSSIISSFGGGRVARRPVPRPMSILPPLRRRFIGKKAQSVRSRRSPRMWDHRNVIKARGMDSQGPW